MTSQNEEDHAKLLNSQSHIWNHIFCFINSMSLKCAVDLGIPDIIHNYGKPMPLSQLIASLPIHPSKAGDVHRLMRVMVNSGIISQNNEQDDVEYTLPEDSIMLLKDHPLSMVPLLQFNLDPTVTKAWHQLSTWYQNDDLKVSSSYDLPPKMSNLFNEAMANDSELIKSVFIDKCKDMFNGLESFVDVAGGTGTVAKAIAGLFPDLKCTVIDLPHVVAGLEGTENLKFVEGDMFKEIPPADAVLLKWILHNWSDEECLAILKNCKEAIKDKGKEGKVIIIDMVVDEENGDRKSVQTQLFFDMLMMLNLTGKQRNNKEWNQLITSAGFSDYKISPILGLRSVIEIFP